jgi:hypothetical protein
MVNWTVPASGSGAGARAEPVAADVAPVRPDAHEWRGDVAQAGGDESQAGRGQALAGNTADRTDGAAGMAPPRTVRRQVKWSAAREEMFLQTLSCTSNVAASIRASGLSESNVYLRRKTSPDFRAKWQTALSEGYVRLESEMLNRAIGGVRRPLLSAGKNMGSVVEYNDRIAMSLLAMHRASVRGADAAESEAQEAALRQLLIDKLAAMNREMGGAG